jgi:hypothetical protein
MCMTPAGDMASNILTAVSVAPALCLLQECLLNNRQSFCKFVATRIRQENQIVCNVDIKIVSRSLSSINLSIVIQLFFLCKDAKCVFHPAQTLKQKTVLQKVTHSGSDVVQAP